VRLTVLESDGLELKTVGGMYEGVNPRDGLESGGKGLGTDGGTTEGNGAEPEGLGFFGGGSFRSELISQDPPRINSRPGNRNFV
jgi:hypothetical protein